MIDCAPFFQQGVMCNTNFNIMSMYHIFVTEKLVEHHAQNILIENHYRG